MNKYGFLEYVKHTITLDGLKKTLKVIKLKYFKLIVDKVLIPEILLKSYLYAKELAVILRKRGIKYFAIEVLKRGHLEASNVSIGLPCKDNRTVSVKILTELGYQSFDSAFGEMNEHAKRLLRNWDKLSVISDS